jgi:general secretion pathway protein K
MTGAEPAGAAGSRGQAGERGIALVVTLWIIVLAALLVSSFNATVKSGLSLMSVEVKESENNALLDAGLEFAALNLIGDDKSRNWLPDGSAHSFPYANALLTIVVDDPNGRVDLNKSDGALVLLLLRQFAGSEAAAQNYLDLINDARAKAEEEQKDEDSDEPQTVAGIGPSRLKTLRSNLRATRQKPIAFDHVSELRQLPGMSLDLYQAIKPFITVYGKTGAINPLSASREVLLSIPHVSKLDVDAALQARSSGGDNNETIKRQLDKGAQYIDLKFGPAFIVTVMVERPGVARAMARRYVIVTGLDDQAPYRLLSVETIEPSA